MSDSKAVKVHLYNAENILKPRGSMQKESIGLIVKEKLEDAFESWTDANYGDLPSEEQLLEILKNNLIGEVTEAWESFCDAHK